MAKKKEGVTEEIVTQPDEEPVVDTATDEIEVIDDLDGVDDVESDGDEIPISDESDESEVVDFVPEPEEQPKSKISDFTPEQLAKAYENLEKVVGRQGQELGELRKKTVQPEPQTPEEKITSMSDVELNQTIDSFKADILKPNAAIEDDDYGQKVILYNDLKEERTLRKITQERESKNAQINNKQAITEFSTTWTKALGDDKLQEVVDFATKKLSDQYGNITKNDLEVALHKLYPTHYTTALRVAVAEQDRKRIATAEATKEPRISGAGSSSVAKESISLKKLHAMDSWERQEFLRKLAVRDPKTFAKVEALLKK